MYCQHCGKSISGDSNFCETCGNKVDRSNVIKPIVTNVGYDDSLPKNSNFMMVIIMLVFIVATSVIYLTSYKEKYDYTQYLEYSYKDSNKEITHKVYLPVGYATKVEEEEGQKFLYIYDDNIIILLGIEKDNYHDYINDNYKEIISVLSKEKITINKNDIKEENDKLILGSFEKDGMYCYLFIYKLNDDADEVVSGYLYGNSKLSDKDVNVLKEVLDRIE